MKKIPRQSEFWSTNEWLEEIANRSDVDIEILKAVVAQLRPELISLPESDKRDQLQRLLKEHTDFMTEIEGNANSWIDVYFERDGEVDVYYQYSMMSHNITGVTEEEAEAMKELAEEEDMELSGQVEDNYLMGTQLDWSGVKEELRLVRKVLNEVYGVDIEDIERAEEERDGEVISWTEI